MKLFCNCKDDKVLKTFEDTILKVVESLEKTNNKFYEMAAKIQVEHMKQLDSQTDKTADLFERITDKFIKQLEIKKEKEVETMFDKVSRLDAVETNSIEKEQEMEDPLADFSHIPIQDIANIQFDGEEEIYPIEH